MSSGICEECGIFTRQTKEQNGEVLCHDCAEDKEDE